VNTTTATSATTEGRGRIWPAERRGDGRGAGTVAPPSAVHATPLKTSMPSIPWIALIDVRPWRYVGLEEAAVIRLATAADAAAVAEVYAPVVSESAISFELVPPTAGEMAMRIARALAHAPWLVSTEGGTVLGFAYASPHSERAAYQWSVNVSVYVDAAARRRGVGRSLYGSLFSLLLLQGFYTAHAGTTLPNPASVGLHESLGFHPVGVYRSVGYKRGAWHDVGWWQLPLKDRTGEPPPPRPPSAVRTHPEWEAALREGEAGLGPTR